MHAPLRTRRVSSKRSPWVTNELRHLIFNRDFLKKRAISSKDSQKWSQYRHARNQVNNEIKKAKRLYFTKNLDKHKGDMKKTWKLINELNLRNCTKMKRISEIKIGEQVVASPVEMAETFIIAISQMLELILQLKYLLLSITQRSISHLQIKRSTCKLLRLIESTDC